MKIIKYNEYKTEAKIGDILIFRGKGILDGFKNMNKARSYKVINTDNHISFKQYRCKRICIVSNGYEDQEVAILTQKEFWQLPIY